MANFMTEHSTHATRRGLVLRKRVRPVEVRVVKKSDDAHKLQAELCERIATPSDLSTMTKFTSAMSLDDIMTKIMGTSLNTEKIATS